MITKKKKVMYFVGQYKSGLPPNVVFEMQGIFTSKKRAIKACRKRNYFYVPMVVNKNSPDRTIETNDIIYPNA